MRRSPPMTGERNMTLTSKTELPNLDPRQLDTILAALRYWQREGQGSSGHERDIAEEHGDALNANEIDELCERINGASPTRHNVLAAALAMDEGDRLTIIRALMESCGQVECLTLTAADVLDEARENMTTPGRWSFEEGDQEAEPFLTEDIALDACHEAAERDWTATYDQAAGDALRLLMDRARTLRDAAKVTPSTNP